MPRARGPLPRIGLAGIEHIMNRVSEVKVCDTRRHTARPVPAAGFLPWVSGSILDFLEAGCNRPGGLGSDMDVSLREGDFDAQLPEAAVDLEPDGRFNR